MSKTCAICGEKIQFLSENNLSKDHKKTKICFTCYEYVATAIKGNETAVERLRERYREDISETTTSYINFLDKSINSQNKEKNEKKDEFMKLMSNDLSKQKKAAPKTNIIRLDKLTVAKSDRLIRIQIISSILVFVFLVLGLLFSFYIFTQGYGAMLAIVMAILSFGFAILFSFIKTFLSVILDSE